MYSSTFMRVFAMNTSAIPKCFVCGSDMWLEIKDHSWGQSQVWRCRAPSSHNVLQAIPKKWWGSVIQYTKQRGWSHDIDKLVEKARQHTLGIEVSGD